MPLLIKVDDQIAKDEARRLVAPTTTASTPGEKRPRKSVRSDGTARLLTVPAIMQLLEEQEEAKDAKKSKKLSPATKKQAATAPAFEKQKINQGFQLQPVILLPPQQASSFPGLPHVQRIVIH